ncbi:MAG: glycoside hydrolase family 43 protein [Oscillospiraceae bacterium]|nr:glycoside hydrolase family 43 protein [Oscillospiraceae bacterium]
MGYFFAHFTSRGYDDRESVWFSVSRDGLHWTDLGNGEPALRSEIGTRGIRDPFPVYDPRLGKYFLLATDLNTKSGNWDDFSLRGSRSLLIWESADLIRWSEPRLAELAPPDAGCAWAPEAVWCTERYCWLVFWASCVKEEGDPVPKQRIYAAFTRGFRSFEPTFQWIEGPHDIIDTDVVRDGEFYYRFSKDDREKTITVERSRVLVPESGDGWERVPSSLLDHFDGLEGPAAYWLEDRGQWCLLVDQYRKQTGYLPLVTDDLASGDFRVLDPAAYDLGARLKRHGGVVRIPDEDYARIAPKG